jgi:hypothetical protein
VSAGQLSPEAALEALRVLPFEELQGVARVDHHRELRTGFPEVVFGESKSAAQIAQILAALEQRAGRALATRVDEDKARAVQAQLPHAVYHPLGRALVVQSAGPPPRAGRGQIAVVSAGTSDLPVAAEARITAEFLGHEVVQVEDVGIAGLPRLLAACETLRAAEVCIVVAGMEGALPGVVASLIDRPLIAVPTSVGYGASRGGFAALLSMLSSCAPGITVVNIDNGFGAAAAAIRINRMPAAPDAVRTGGSP